MQTKDLTLSASLVDKIMAVVNQIKNQYKVDEETGMLLEMIAFRAVGIALKHEEGDGWQK